MARIANDFERQRGLPMSAGLLRRINGIENPRRLRAGVRIRIPTERLHVVVEKSTWSMKVFLGDVIIRLYDVGLGRNGCTPAVEFTVQEKQRNPSWTNPETGELIAAGDPRNLVGDYFTEIEEV